MTRVVFQAVNAWNWNPDDLKKCKFRQEDGGQECFVNGELRPNGGAAPLPWVVDDEVFGATTVKKKGDSKGVYVEVAHAAEKGFLLPPVGYRSDTPYSRDYGSRPYEFLTVLYSTDHGGELAGARYYGFHGLWIDGDENHALMLISHGGDSRNTVDGTVIRHEVNLTDPRQVIPSAELVRELAYARPQRDSGAGGALFLRCREAKAQKLRIPKLPQSLISNKIPTCTPREE